MITSFRNPLVKRIKRLRQKKYRQREGAFFIEGLRVVLAAVESGAPIEIIVYSPELLTSDFARQVVADQVAAGMAVETVSGPVFAAVSERENPAGLGAIVRPSTWELAALPIGPESLYLALVEASDPGNLGTVLRTLDAVGASGLVLVGPAVDPFHPTAVKASMGTLFTVPMAHVDDLVVLLDWAREGRLQTVASSARAGMSFWDAPYRRPALLLLGSEGQGLSPEVIAAADLSVRIPMHGSATSLNLAVAAGLLLFEMDRRRDR